MDSLIQLIAVVQQYFIVPVMLVFVLIVVVTYWPSRRASMERQGRIPFDADR